MTTKRTARLSRKTKETKIELTLNLDGIGTTKISTGVGFVNHMVQQLAFWACWDLELTASGDIEVDDHHTVEDVGIALGGALVQALGEKPRIRRFGFAYAPLDEALSRVSLDLSGRPMAIVKAEFTSKRLGKMDVQNIEEFLQGFARGAKATLHAQVEYGRNDHHKAESMFKALGMALRQAVQVDEVRRSTPSTKGVL